MLIWDPNREDPYAGNWSTTGAWLYEETNTPYTWGDAFCNSANVVFPDTVETIAVDMAAVNVASITFGVSGCTIKGNYAITLTGIDADVKVEANQSATISAELAGTVGLTKSGEGTLILTAANSYSGGTTIEEGTLQFDGIAILPPGDIVNNDSLIFSFNAVRTIANDISGTGTVRQDGSNILNSYRRQHLHGNYIYSRRGALADRQ